MKNSTLLCGRVVVVIFGFAAFGCAGDGTGLDPNGNPIVTTSGITVSLDEFALPIGGSVTLEATTLDDQGSVIAGRTVTWTSSNLTVATVDAMTGVVTAIGSGEASITAESDGATAVSAGVVVTSATFSGDVQPIFSANCAFNGCHAGTTPQQGQDLSLGNAYANVVNVPSMEVPTMDRIEPREPLLSYLVHKIRGTFASVGGTGGQMPLGAGELPEGEINIIRAWVQSGALNN